MKVLHIASFSGNIGDNANHIGFRAEFQKMLGSIPHYTNLEIREFFWKKRFFDHSFAEMCNLHDLVIIGGGNFFELWVESSATGTSIDIAPDILKQIKTPMLFNALGCDPHMGAPDICIQKFRAFLDVVLESKQFFVSLRNDGALENMRQFVGEAYSNSVMRVPDGGFFFRPNQFNHIEPMKADRFIAINLAGDMLDRRFDGKGSNLTSEAYIASLADVLVEVAEEAPDLGFVLIPHIFRDMSPIASLMDHLPDHLRRTKVAVSPLVQGEEAAHYQFSLYQSAALVLGTRFHSNVCPLGMRVPTLGMSCYPQITNLYREIGNLHWCVEVNRQGFQKPLKTKILNALESNGLDMRSGLSEVNRELAEMKSDYMQKLAAWMKG